MPKVGFTKVKVTDKKGALAAWQRKIKGLNSSRLRVGVLGEKATEKHADSDVTNVEIASFHEFGTSRTPERSFIRSTFDEKEKEIANVMKRVAAAVVAGKIAEGQGLELVGQFTVAKIIEKIRSNIPPALSEATIKAKGSSTALIDSGQLVQSITYEVQDAKKSKE